MLQKSITKENTSQKH